MPYKNSYNHFFVVQLWALDCVTSPQGRKNVENCNHGNLYANLKQLKKITLVDYNNEP